MGSGVGNSATATPETINVEKDCRYKFLIEEGELTLSSNPTIVIREVKGVRLEAPVTESVEMTNRLLNDLLAADLDSIEGYIDTSELGVDVITLIAWRATVRPVRLEVAHCSPEFALADLPPASEESSNASTTPVRPKTSPEPLFFAEFWLCDLAVRYATNEGGQPGSGVWTVKVKHMLTTGERVVIPGNPGQ